MFSSSLLSSSSLKLLIILFSFSNSYFRECEAQIHYNIPDPECTGSFGLCSVDDKLRLGYSAIAKLHEKMDEDKDGSIEIQETQEFIKEDFKNGVHEERQKKFHGSDTSITIEEMWKAWQYSAAYNWTTEEMVFWVTEQVKLPEYAENFRRNQIDGQFLPRLILNENHYYSNIMQIKDTRHKRLFILKATDVVLFGAQQSHNLVKDAIMIGALTLSIFFCIFLYSKHCKSSEQIKLMLIEFDKLNMINEANNLKLELPTSTTINSNDLNEKLKILTKRSSLDGTSLQNFAINSENEAVDRENTGKLSKNNSQDDEKSLYQLRQAEQELERMRAALKKTESRLDMVKYQPPVVLITLLNKTYESEKALLDFKLTMIEKEKLECVDSLNRVVKRQSGFMGALKIAHSSTLEDIQHRLEGLKTKHHKLKLEQQESMKRWNSIFEMCMRNDNSTQGISAVSSDTIASQDILKKAIECLKNANIEGLPRKTWQQNTSQIPHTASSLNINDLIADSFYSTVVQLFQANLVGALGTKNSSSIPEKLNNIQINSNQNIETRSSSIFIDNNSMLTGHILPVHESIVLNDNHRKGLIKNVHENLKSDVNFSLTCSSSDLSSSEAPVGRTDSSRSKYTIGDRISTAPNFKFIPPQNNKDEINNNCINTTESLKLHNLVYPSNTIDKYSGENPPERQNLVIISANNLPQTTSPQKSKPNPNADGKVARDSLIHVPSQLNEPMFQFSDVDSVQTADFFVKKTPHSSFESDDTYKSNSILPFIIKTKNPKSGTNLSNTSHNPKDKPLSFIRSSFSKIPKTNSNHKENGTSESMQSLERISARDSFKTTMNSLKSKIFSSNKNLVNPQQTIKLSRTLDTLPRLTPKMPAETFPVSMVHLTMPNGNKQQLTISNKIDTITNNQSKSNSASNLLNIIIPPPRTSNYSNASFTVQSLNKLDSNSLVNTDDARQISIVENEKKVTSLFTFKNKSKKSKSPKKGKK